jgi:hypothetical protein
MREIVMPLHMYSAKQNIQKSEFVTLRHHSENCRKQAIDQISDVAGLAERPPINPVPAIEGKQFQPMLAHEAPEMSLPYIGYTFKRFETNYQPELARPISTNFEDLDPTPSRPGPSAVLLPSARRTAYSSKATYTPSSPATTLSSLDFGPPRSLNAAIINNNFQGAMKGFRQRIVPDRQARLPVIESQEKNSQDTRGRLDQPKMGSPHEWQENQAHFVGDGLTAGYEEDQLSLARQLQAEFGSGSKKSKKEDPQDRIVTTAAATGLPSVPVPEMRTEEVRPGLGPMVKKKPKGDRAPSWKLSLKPAVTSRSSLTTTPLPQMPTSTFPTGKDTLPPMNQMLEPVNRKSANSSSIFTIDESLSDLSGHLASPVSNAEPEQGDPTENTAPEAASRGISSKRIFGSRAAEKATASDPEEKPQPRPHVIPTDEHSTSKNEEESDIALSRQREILEKRGRLEQLKKKKRKKRLSTADNNEVHNLMESRSRRRGSQPNSESSIDHHVDQQTNGPRKAPPYDFPAVVVEPEIPLGRRSPPKGSNPSTANSSHVPGAFDDDLDFNATVAAGLQDTGFDHNIVINDPSFRRSDFPPGSNEIGIYRTPYTETVSDLRPIPRTARACDYSPNSASYRPVACDACSAKGETECGGKPCFNCLQIGIECENSLEFDPAIIAQMNEASRVNLEALPPNSLGASADPAPAPLVSSGNWAPFKKSGPRLKKVENEEEKFDAMGNKTISTKKVKKLPSTELRKKKDRMARRKRGEESKVYLFHCLTSSPTFLVYSALYEVNHANLLLVVFTDEDDSTPPNEWNDSGIKYRKAIDFPEVPGEEQRNSTLTQHREQYAQSREGSTTYQSTHPSGQRPPAIGDGPNNLFGGIMAGHGPYVPGLAPPPPTQSVPYNPPPQRMSQPGPLPLRPPPQHYSPFQKFVYDQGPVLKRNDPPSPKETGIKRQRSVSSIVHHTLYHKSNTSNNRPHPSTDVTAVIQQSLLNGSAVPMVTRPSAIIVAFITRHQFKRTR